jgi:hypothetical protein
MGPTKLDRDDVPAIDVAGDADACAERGARREDAAGDVEAISNTLNTWFCQERNIMNPVCELAARPPPQLRP